MEGINFKPEIDIEDRDEARDLIEEMFNKGERPCVTVPKIYLSALEKGLRPHSTWVSADLIVGTFGRKPYLPKTENTGDRAIVYIKEISPKSIEPRFTGSDNHFHGVVVLSGPISPESIEVLN